MRNTLYNLEKDLNYLYCVTKNSKIEDVFIRLAEALVKDFPDWFSKNRSAIKPMLQNSDVADLMDALIETKRHYYNVSIVDFVNMMQGGNKKISGGIGRNVGNIKSLSRLVSDPDLQKILSPYQDIILASQNFSEEPTIPVDIIASDLKTIISAYSTYVSEISSVRKERQPTGKLNSKEKRKQFFAYALRRFNEDISGAAERHGMIDLSTRIKNEGLLAKPAVIGEYIDVSSANTFTKNRADDIVKLSLKNINEDKFEVMYEYIKEQVMEFMGFVSVSDLAQLYRERERTEDMSDYLGTEKGTSRIITMDTNDDMWLNPSVLGMISYILNYMYRLIKD